MEPNEAMKAMARRIAADAVAKSDSPDRARRMILSGEADDWHGVRSALAAIMETQRLDADLANALLRVGLPSDIPTAIRTGEHYALAGDRHG